jgi:hypothetical protein
MVEARIQIQSSTEPGGGGGGHGGHRRSGPSGPDSFLHNDHKWNKLLRYAPQGRGSRRGIKIVGHRRARKSMDDGCQNGGAKACGLRC